MPKTKSQVIVFVQLSTIFAILLTGPLFADNSILLLIELTGIILGGWALLTMIIRSKYNVFPDVRKEAKLLISGPYKYIRHPMYTSVFLIAIMLVFNHPSFFRLISLFLLISIHLYKIEYEESMLKRHFGSYKKYMLKTHKLIPFIY